MINKKDIQDIYTLSPMQEGMFFHSLYNKSSAAYFEQISYRLYGELDIPLIKKSLDELLMRFDVLRTVFIYEGTDRPLQVVLKKRECDFYHLSLNDGIDATAKEIFIKEFKEKDRQRSFDLTQDVLLRVAVIKLDKEEYEFTWSCHHIIIDGWCMGILVSDFFEIYNSFLENRKYLLPPVKPYRLYIQWLERQDKKKATQYWRDYLDLFEEQTGVPKTKISKEGIPYKNENLAAVFDMEKTSTLNKLAAVNNTTMNILTRVIWGILLGKYNCKDDVVFGAVVSGRPSELNGVESMVGLFINTIPVRIRIEEKMKFSHLLRLIQGEALAGEPYHYCALAEIQSGTLLKQNLIDHILVFENYPMAEQIEGYENDKNKSNNISIKLANVDVFEQTNYDFNVILGGPERLRLSFQYNGNVYDRDFLESISRRFSYIVEQIIKDQDVEIKELTLLSGEEKNRLLFGFNDTAAEYPRDKTIHQLFAEQAAQKPDAIALVAQETAETREKHEKLITYLQLNEQSNHLARLLIEKGVLADNIVGIMMERSVEMIIGIMGILKSGGAYLPIDPGYPQERIKYMLHDSKAEIIVNSEFLMDALQAPFLQHSAFSILHSNHLAYIIYTSGSTGNPKGVMIEHRSLINYVWWASLYYMKGEKLNFPFYTSISFDLTVTSVFLPLITGNSVILYGGQNTPMETIADIINDNRVGIMKLTPAHLKIIKEITLRNTCTIKRFILGGENLDSVLAADIYKKFNGGIEIYNEYGPTEATVGCMIYRYSPEKDQRASVPIGAPVDNVKIYLLDNYGYPVAPGVIGEIYIGGDGIARGYLNRPELTAEKFVKKYRSYGSYKTYININYKTGDLAKWLPDGPPAGGATKGIIEFLGRIDHQVKIRGFRIELGEIENCLLKISGLKEAVVLVQGENRDDKYLCAYFASDRTWEISGLRETLAGELPDYMIPSYFVQVDKIPLTSNGKVDRGALLNLKVKSLEEDLDYILPANDVEKKLVEIWQKVLGRDKISTNENFFMTGGDSIKAIQIISRMSSAGYKVEMKDIFQYPVISGLAPRVKKLKRIPDQSAISGAVPLTPIQERFFNEPRIDAHHYNQAVILFSREGFDKEAIKAVFAKIQEHHDALRMTYQLAVDNGKVFQMAHGFDYPLSIDEYDLKKHAHSLDEFLRKVNLIQAGINLEKGPLMKLGLFHLDDGDRLLIVIHHLVIDGVSWRILFEDFETLYGQYKQGKKLVLPAKTDSFKRWSEQLSKYANSKGFLKEKTYWQKIESFEVPPIPKDFDDDNADIANTVGASFTLEEKETGLLRTKVNRAFRTEINDILLTALAAAIKKTFGSNPVCIALEGHGREEILEDMDIGRTVGWFTSLYPVVLDVSYTNDLGRQVKEVKETLRQIPNKGIGCGILRYLTEAANKNGLEFKLKPQIIFNYLGQFDADVKQKSFFEISRESVGNSQSLNNKQEYILNVSGMTANSRLTMNISYNKLHFKPGTMAQLTGNFEFELKSIIAFCSSQETVVPTPADFTYKGLSIEIIDRLVKEYPGIQELYTLSPMQEGMLFHTLLDDSSASYHEQMSYRLEGELDIPVVEKSLNELFKRHDILRTAFVHQDIVRPVQVVLNERTIDFYYEDLCPINEPDEKENHIREFKTKEKYRSFNLSKDVLMRVAIFKLDESGYEFIWSFHHILMDGWCMGILNTEFFEIYSGYVGNQPRRLPVVIPYREYIQWLEKEDKEDSARYWKNYLESFEEPTGVPKTKPARELKAVENEMVSLQLDMEKTALLNQLAGRNNVTVNTVIQAVWGILLGKYNGKEDVVFGAVVSGRPSELPGVESIVGLFINTIPVRIRWHGKRKFNHMIHLVQKESLAGSRYHYHPLAEIQSMSILKQNLIDHIFIFENYPIAERIEGYGKGNEIYLQLTNIEVFEQTNYDFNVVLAGSDQFKIIFHYNGNAYDREFIERLAQHFSIVLDQVLKDPGMGTRGLTLLSEEEKNRVLYEFNNTAADYPKDKSIHQLFAEQAAQTPDAIALVAQETAETREKHEKNITYLQLNEQSDNLAGLLSEKGVLPDNIVGIMMERSVGMIIGILGILKSGGAYLPIDPDYPQERINYMVKDSGAKIMIGRAEAQKSGRAEKASSLPRFLASNSSNLAYVIYTSGSTGKPKGVMVEHRNVVNLAISQKKRFAVNEKDRILQFSSICFDASVEQIFTAFFSGAVLLLIDKNTLLDNIKFEELISSRLITHLHAVPSFLNNISLKKAYQLKRVISGGDVCPPGLARKYGAYCDFYNEYGPTETTVTSIEIQYTDFNEVLDYLPIGKPIANTYVYVFDIWLKPVPLGVAGELYIGGSGVTRGYLNNPELTAERFIEYRSYKSYKTYILYKTGDLARWLKDGNIEFLGRIDQQVKIRGFRIELGEIKNCLLKIGEIKEAVILAREADRNDKYICAYLVSDKVWETSELRDLLANQLPDYMIPSYFVQVDKIPLTPNGKIDLKTLQGLEVETVSQKNKYAAPQTEKEKLLSEIWGEVFNKEKVGLYDNFFDIGGHSLKAISVISHINKEFGLKLPLSTIFEKPTIAELAQVMDKEKKKTPIDIHQCPVNDSYPLSHAQKRLWFFYQMEPTNPAYNIIDIKRIPGDLDIEVFNRSLGLLSDRHEALRTSITVATNSGMEEMPVQIIHDKVETVVQEKDISNFPGEEKKGMLSRLIEEEGKKPFNFNEAPLFRALLIKLNHRDYLLIFIIHHIISDGSSMNLLVREFTYLYDKLKKNLTPDLPPMAFQYKDFAYWHNHMLEENYFKEQREYWHKKLAGQLPVLDLHTDYPRPAYQSSRGDRVVIIIDEDLTQKMRHLARKKLTSSFMILTAVFKTLLYRYTGQEDILLGTLISGRSTPDMEKVAGYFVNILALRDSVDGQVTFEDFLNNVKHTMLESFDNQDYPFDKLVEELKVGRSLGRSPVFDILLVYQNIAPIVLPTCSAPGSLNLQGFEKDYVVSKYDLYLDIFDETNQIGINLEFCVDLFKRETVERMTRHFLHLLHDAVDNPQLSIAQLGMLSEEEKKQLIIDFNRVNLDYCRDKTIHHFVEEHAGKNPDRAATVFMEMGNREAVLTYRELNERVNLLMQKLNRAGVHAYDPVGILMERSQAMAESILAIWKLGGCYIPLDIQHPPHRISSILNDSGTKTLISKEYLLNSRPLESYGGTIFYHGLPGENKLEGSPGKQLNMEKNFDMKSLAYVIYTSGSTGKPKGAMVEHDGMMNHMQVKIQELQLTDTCIVAQNATHTFDISVWQFFSALIPGGKTVIYPDILIANPGEFANRLVKDQITILEVVPSYLSMLLDYIEDTRIQSVLPLALQYLLVTGEEIKLHLVKKWFARYPGIKMVNAYGPTEASDDITHYIMDKAPEIRHGVPIGSPVQNMQIYIVDKYMNMCPVGVNGELIVAGVGVGRGYLNRPELTAEKFIKNNRSYRSNRTNIFYKTGDLGLWLPDGNIEFLGRIDYQVKVRGFRIELGEIESCLLDCAGIKQAVVIVHADEKRGDYLCAYVVCDTTAQGQAQAQDVDTAALKIELIKKLPVYMVPAFFIKMDAIPLLPSGKVDRKLLPEPVMTDTVTREFVGPTTKTEKKIAEIWAKILEIDKISIHDNFFDLGGHSLLIPRLFNQLNKEFPNKLQVVDVFEIPTIYQVARHIDGVTENEADDDVIVELSID